MLKPLTIQEPEVSSASIGRADAELHSTGRRFAGRLPGAAEAIAETPAVIVSMIMMSVQSAVGCGAGDGANGTPQIIKQLQIIPWVELNYRKYDERIIEGLLIWKNVTDTAIVSTRPTRASVYAKLRRHVPGMRIIPGLKPNGADIDLLPTLDSVDGWQAVAREVAAIREASGERVMLIDNERAVYPFIRGEQSVDMSRFRRALKYLPNDIEYLWYPSVFGKEAEQMRCAEVCRAVQDVLANVRFLDQRFQGKPAVTDPARIAADRRLKAIANRPTLHMMYFYGTGHPHIWWRDDQIFEALSHLQKGPDNPTDVVLYPGVKRWVEAARSLSGRLRSPPSSGEP